MARNSLPTAVQDCHNLLIWLIPLLDNFPRNRRFTLGERLESVLIEILELLVRRAGKPKRIPPVEGQLFSGWIPQGERFSTQRIVKCEPGVWQRRFWYRLIREEHDFERHADSIHYNPVKHGHVDSVVDWPYSS